MKTSKLSIEQMRNKLSRSEMKNIMAGSDGGVICTACNSDSDCDYRHVCRSSPSCVQPKVCALPYWV